MRPRRGPGHCPACRDPCHYYSVRKLLTGFAVAARADS